MSTPEPALVELRPGSGAAQHHTVVTGPGLGTSATHLYGEFARTLPEGARVLGWDLPGHGASAPADEFTVGELAEGVLAGLGAQGLTGAFHYVGTSIGGAVGQYLLEHHPGRLASLTLVATTDYFPDPESWSERAELVARAGTPTQVPLCARAWFAPGFLGRHPERATPLLHDLQNADRLAYAAACRALAEFDLRDIKGSHGVRVLAVSGEHDAVTGPELVELLARKLGGRHRSVEGTAHLLAVEEPAELAALVAGQLTAPA